MTLIDVDGRKLRLSNLEKVLWPATGYSKGDLIAYYADIAPVLLPHLEARPLTIRRFPDGIGGVSWHQNECRGEPEWFPVFETSGRAGRRLRFCMVDGAASLLWLANQAAIELHPFTWRVESPRQPMSLVFDLDPGAPAGLLEAARVALLLRSLLEDLGLRAFVKGSGSLGLHLHVPLEAPLATKELAHRIAATLAQRHPDEVVAEAPRDARVGKVYVDWLQNDPSRQTVAPYSVRAMPVPTVAAPFSWEEVEEAVAAGRPEPLTVLVDDIPRRIERCGDLFAGFVEAERASALRAEGRADDGG